MSRNYTLINYFINRVSINHLVISYLCGFATIPFHLLTLFWELFISLMLILQMGNTRNHNTNTENNNRENNQDANPPPPPPPTLEQVLDMQTHILQTMQQTMVNMWTTQPQLPPLPLRDRLGDF
jgi:hypothetical protein